MLQSKLFYLLFLFSLSLVFSCGSDDDSIEGTYKIISFMTAGCDDPEENFNFDFSANDGCSTVLGQEVCGDGTMTLSASGTFVFEITVTVIGQSFTQSGNGSYTIDGNTITICDGSECETTTFTLGSGVITLKFTDSDDSCTLTIRGEKI